MENATKALLIAAAILIAILIISMGIVVYRQSAEQVNKADLSDTEKTAFNAKFEQYAGHQSAENVKSLVKVIVNNNANANNPKVGLTNSASINPTIAISATATATTITLPNLSGVNRQTGYNITMTYANGYVSNITVGN